MRRSRNDEKEGWRAPHDIAPPGVAEVERLLAPWLGGRHVLSIDALAGGLVNRNCRLEIESAPAPVVLRIYDRDPAACAKELAILSLVRERVPVPAVLYADPEPERAAPPFALLEFIPGISLKTLLRAGNPAATAEAAYDAGLLLSRLTAYRFPSTGLLTPDLAVDSSDFAGAMTTADLVEHFARSPTFQRRIAAPLLQRLLDAARSAAAPSDSAAQLVHGDFNSRNVLVHDVGGRWSVAAILDWEYAFAASPLCDVGNFLRYERAASPRFEPAFSRGCRDGGLALDGDWRHSARLADLPALCELLTREPVPADIVTELIELVTATVERRDAHL